MIKIKKKFAAIIVEIFIVLWTTVEILIIIPIIAVTDELIRLKRRYTHDQN